MLRNQKRMNGMESKRSYFGKAGCFLFMMLLVVTEVAGRPQDETEHNLRLEDYDFDIDNIEIRQVKMVNGVIQEDHPIIMYREDIVRGTDNEDGSELKKSHSAKKYKDFPKYRRFDNKNSKKETTHYKIIEPKAIYFDDLPETPIVKLDMDDLGSSEEKFDPSKIETELIPLIDVVAPKQNGTNLEGNEKDSKKKRMRRSTPNESNDRIKRNPYYHYATPYLNSYYYQVPCPQPHVYQNGYIYQKNPVIGNRQPPATETRFLFPTEDNVDKIIFPSQIISRRPQPAPTTEAPIAPIAPTARPTRPKLDLSHDSDPANADFSAYEFESGISNKNSQDSAAGNAAPGRSSILKCEWAIVYCCSSETRLRSSCFDNYGCPGPFWGSDPCDPQLQQKVIRFVEEYYQRQ